MTSPHVLCSLFPGFCSYFTASSLASLPPAFPCAGLCFTAVWVEWFTLSARLLCVPTSCFSSNIQVNVAPGKQHALGLWMLVGNILPSQNFLHVGVSCLFWRYSLEPSPVQCLHWITSSNPHLQLGVSSLCSLDTRRTATDESLLLL